MSLSSLSTMGWSFGSLMIEGGKQLLQLAVDTTTSPAVDPVNPESEDTSLSSLVPAAILTTAAIGLGYCCYSFWSARNRVTHVADKAEHSAQLKP